jgi:hypothetical protein
MVWFMRAAADDDDGADGDDKIGKRFFSELAYKSYAAAFAKYPTNII